MKQSVDFSSFPSTMHYSKSLGLRMVSCQTRHATSGESLNASQEVSDIDGNGALTPKRLSLTRHAEDLGFLHSAQ